VRAVGLRWALVYIDRSRLHTVGQMRCAVEVWRFGWRLRGAGCKWKKSPSTLSGSRPTRNFRSARL